MKWFHKPSGRLMVATPTLRDELMAHGFRNVSPWTRGVDTEQFNRTSSASMTSWGARTGRVRSG